MYSCWLIWDFCLKIYCSDRVWLVLCGIWIEDKVGYDVFEKFLVGVGKLNVRLC